MSIWRTPRMRIDFQKMVAAGNDFVVVDHRDLRFQTVLPQLARAFCDRHFGIGSDGLLLLEPSERADFRMGFLNPDGSSGMMCGNGGRAIARFALAVGAAGKTMRFEAAGRIYRATLLDTAVKLILPAPRIIRELRVLTTSAGTLRCTAVDSGADHVVIDADSLPAEVSSVDVTSLGREIRYHKSFSPAGTNVSFVGTLREGIPEIRTYERGVEAETLACGTGSVAAACALVAWGRTQYPVRLRTRSGATLVVDTLTEDGVEFASLTGDVHFVFSGSAEFDETLGTLSSLHES
ncbi:MAG: diaminopimelate epimerase [Ignavibacteriales bacterium CG07_land_8_20_14_0_80_59_12]|nr:MAG: diaminopimelate epimerase [Ignavibacteriales bacterium CG07_land_8_20_14_0_80_59_12]